jgi:transcriptional regulator GlxA family with amidase domain
MDHDSHFAWSDRVAVRVSKLLQRQSTKYLIGSHASVVANAVSCTDRRICRVLVVLAQDLSHRTSLIQAAQIAGLTPNYFSSCFRKDVGITFVQWSARLRVSEAKKLLGITDLSITAVAATVGYADVTTFERVFRRIEGTCPRKYRCLLRRDRGANVRNAESSVKNAETMAIDEPYLEQSVLEGLLSVADGARNPERPANGQNIQGDAA